MSEKNKDVVYVGLEKVPLRSEREEKNKKAKRTLLTIVLCVVFLVIGFIAGYIFIYKMHPINRFDATNTMGEIEAMLDNYWIYSDDYDDLDTELEDKAFYGMTSFDEDPYTTSLFFSDILLLYI